MYGKLAVKNKLNSTTKEYMYYILIKSMQNLKSLTISRMQIFPLTLTVSTAALLVPYMFPENSAVSMKSPFSIAAVMVSLSVKK